DEGSSPSSKSVNNEALVIDAEPLTVVHPLEFAENIGNSDDAPSEKDEAAGKRKQPDESSGKEPRQKAQKIPPQVSKASGDASNALDVNSDPDIHDFPSAKELKDFVDSYIRSAVFDNMLNSRTCKLMSTLSNARGSCDAIREREIEKDKAYAELERKCNDAPHDFDKNPLMLDIRVDIETLQGQVDMLHDIDGIGQDRVAVVAKVVPYVVMELVRSDEIGLLVAWLVKVAMFRGAEATDDPYSSLEVLL
ncbi:hypothetical protein Tco_0584136, partial [Tanacetum coccineum]